MPFKFLFFVFATIKVQKFTLVSFHCVTGRFIDVLDQLDTRVEKLRKEALKLQEKRDVMLMSMDIIKNNELLNNLNECKS